MSKEKLNCFIKQGANSPWVPAVKLPDGQFASAKGWLLFTPTEVRDATYEEITAECAARGEIVSDKDISGTGYGPYYSAELRHD